MIEFNILKKSKKSWARVGILKTPHGEIETPCLVPVATQAVVKTLSIEEVHQTNTQLLIANTFHLHLKPGEDVVKKAGGLHQFMQWKNPIMTDSGGFQVFSLGFGHDLQIGKLLKYFPEKNNHRNNSNIWKSDFQILRGMQPKKIRITNDGVHFQSPLDGHKIFIGPRESIHIQESLGADIIFAFDECTPPLATREYIEMSLERTHRWATICKKTQKSKQALFGIVQGSHFKDLREKSAAYINALDFPGYGIGGDLGTDKKTMAQILKWTVPNLDAKKPKHLLGIGYLEDMEMVIRHGIDLFDCTVPTHYARRGIAFTSAGKLNLGKSLFLGEHKKLDKTCACTTCSTYTRAYICHLLRAKEITGMKLLTFHNLYFFNNAVTKLRTAIKREEL